MIYVDSNYWIYWLDTLLHPTAFSYGRAIYASIDAQKPVHSSVGGEKASYLFHEPPNHLAGNPDRLRP